ncbi:unnamed protein product [Colias eurytheme]|nr:unnamed protein product [Colias eurytheme]
MFLYAILMVMLNNAIIIETKTINDVAAEIATKEFANKSTTVIWWKTDSQNIDTFNKLYDGLVVTTYLKHIDIGYNDTLLSDATLNDQVIIYVTNENEFSVILTVINKIRVKTIRVILVILETIEDNIKMTEYTRTAWDNDVADIIIISVNLKNEIVLNTFIPYSDGRCGDYTPVALSANKPKLFSNKFHNFHKCPIRMRAFVLPPYVMYENRSDPNTVRGFDTDVMKFILEKLNATIVVVSDENVNNTIFNFANLSLSENLGDLTNNLADVAVPPFIITNKRYAVAQAFYACYNIPVIWCAPRQREIYAWAKVILPFYLVYRLL